MKWLKVPVYTMKKKFMQIAFFTYVLFLYIFVIVKFYRNTYALTIRRWHIQQSRDAGFWNCNFIPFRTMVPVVKNFMKEISNNGVFYCFKHSTSLKYLVGNTICFMPLGFMLPMAFIKFKKFYKVLFISVSIITFFELFQFITMLGICDIDDIILNSASSSIGFIIWKCISKKDEPLH